MFLTRITYHGWKTKVKEILKTIKGKWSSQEVSEILSKKQNNLKQIIVHKTAQSSKKIKS
jgi:hypothetical protein